MTTQMAGDEYTQPSEGVMLTDWLLRQPPRYSFGLIVNRPHKMTVVGRLYQARMWREYAMAWDGKPTSTGVGMRWVEGVLRISRSECLRRSRINSYLARRLLRASH